MHFGRGASYITGAMLEVGGGMSAGGVKEANRLQNSTLHLSSVCLVGDRGVTSTSGSRGKVICFPLAAAP